MFIYTINDIIGVAVIAILVVFYAFLLVESWSRKRKCKHQELYENRQCHLRCGCGKNFGFIGNYKGTAHIYYNRG